MRAMSKKHPARVSFFGASIPVTHPAAVLAGVMEAGEEPVLTPNKLYVDANLSLQPVSS